MPNDDESKKDDQGSPGVANNQAADQKTPVYLFPENSVYDLEPIVVPDDIRLAPGPAEDDEDAAAQNSPENETEVSSTDIGQGAECGTTGTTETTNAPSAPELSRNDRTAADSDNSSTALPPRGSRLKAKIQVQKVKVTQEQSKIVEDSFKNRLDHSKAAQSRIDQARAELSAKAVEEPGSDSPIVESEPEKALASRHESAEPLSTHQAGQNGADSRNLFPENSVYELDPVVVVSEDQKLMPSRRPTYDPNRVSPKLSPIKFDKFKTSSPEKSSNSQISEASKESSEPEREEPAVHRYTTTASSPSLESQTVSVVQMGSRESDAFSADLTIAGPVTAESEGTSVDDRGVESQSNSRPTAISLSQHSHPESFSVSEKDPSNQWKEEPTGWEEINSRQDRWSEETGWEEAAGNTPWESSGWAERSSEQAVDVNLRQATEQLARETQEAYAPGADDIGKVVEDEHTVTVSESVNEASNPLSFTPKTVGNLFSDGDDDFPRETESMFPTAAAETTSTDAHYNELSSPSGPADSISVTPETENWDEQGKASSTTSGASTEMEITDDWRKNDRRNNNRQAETHGAITGEQEIAEHGRLGSEPATGERPGITETESAENRQELPEHICEDGGQEIAHAREEQDISERGRITAEHNTSGFDDTDQPVPGFKTKKSIPTPLFTEYANAEAYITGEQKIDPMAFVTGEQPEHSDAPQMISSGNPGEEATSEEKSVSALSKAILSTEAELSADSENSLSESILSEAESMQSNFEPPVPEPFDLNRIGIATADIEQIFVEHDCLHLTTEDQSAGNQESDEYSYDEEDVLQDFRSTDSIYELAPFVLPASSDRLTDEEQKKPSLSKQPTVQQIVRHAETPERPAIPTYSTDPLVGTVLAHSYEILDVIGQGGMAIVYRAKQIATGRLVAIKTLRSPNPQDVLRFSQEIKTHSQLDHKNIVGYIDSFTARDQKFLVMERVRGISLQEIIRALGKLEEPENIVDIVSQILDALDYAHAGGLIHRDLKTGNIILIKEIDNDMVVKILDFGIAKVQGDTQRLTHVGQALGSPIYMSPEQCSGKPLSTRSDLYSLGVLLYESVTGTPPYSKGTLINVMAAHCNENIKPKPLIEMEVKLPKTKMLDQILQKALQTHPDKRWQSAQEFKSALSFWLKCVQQDLSIEELPVELQRCPVSELDVEKLIGIARGPAASEPVPFQWAPEQSDKSGEPGESWGERTENGEWEREQQQALPGWGEPSQQQTNRDLAPGTDPSFSAQAQDTLQNPAEVPRGIQPWGGSERHRQSQTGDAWRGSAAAAAAAQAASGSSAEHQKSSQAETSDIWSAQQKMQERRPVRDLLAGPADPQTNFEVQTSADLNALGTGLPKLSFDEKQEIRAITNAVPMEQTNPESYSAGTTYDTEEVQSAPIDLRRRQQQVTAAPPTSNWLSTVMIVVVSVVLTFCLSIWYFVSNPNDVQAKFQALQEIFNKPATDSGQPESKKSNSSAGSQEKQQDSSSPQDSLTDIGLELEQPDEAISAADSKRRPESGVKPTDPGEFHKAEPEEGVDF